VTVILSWYHINMSEYIKLLGFVIIGIVLLWIGYSLFFGKMSPLYPFLPWSKRKPLTGKAGDPQICPVCSMNLLKGDQLKTVAFPAREGSVDRIMHIKGCYNCLEKGLPRKCPVCGSNLSIEDFLVSRMFERNYQKNHVHVLGCNKCRKV